MILDVSQQAQVGDSVSISRFFQILTVPEGLGHIHL